LIVLKSQILKLLKTSESVQRVALAFLKI
jgi:hypothetical protein